MTPTSSSSSSAPSMIRPIVEITTSGLTHSWGSGRTCGRQNASPLCSLTYYNQLFRPIFNFFMWIAPWKDLLEHEDNGDGNDTMKCRKNGQRQDSLDLNFAEFDFDWDKEVVTVNMLGRNIHDEPLLRHRFRFDELSGQGEKGSSLVSSSDFDLTEEELVSNSIINATTTGSLYFANDDKWICVSYKGRASPIHHDFAMATTVIFAFMFAIWPILLILALTCTTCMLYKRTRRLRRKRKEEPTQA